MNNMDNISILAYAILVIVQCIYSVVATSNWGIQCLLLLIHISTYSTAATCRRLSAFILCIFKTLCNVYIYHTLLTVYVKLNL